MPIKSFKPTTPTLRYKTQTTFDDVTAKKPYKPLTKGKNRIDGRGSSGRITVRRRGRGHKRKYRIIDFKRNKTDIPGKVATIEYDPNRTVRIALINYVDGEKRYILAPRDIKPGDMIVAGESVKIAPGNAMPLKNIPLGTEIHNIEMQPGKGGQICRSAGGAAVLLAKEGKYCHIRMPSSEVRLISSRCYATIGQLSHIDHMNVKIGKAGRSRWMGRRPKVRGVVMNPVDHPHGGGEGKSSGGRHPCSPTGQPTKGYKTRKKNKPSNKYIITRRKKK